MNMRKDAGFTLLELLIAAAILVVLLSTLGGMYASSSRAYETNRSVTEAAGQLRTAVQAIQRDVSQAGFSGWATEATFQPFDFELGEYVQVESGRDRWHLDSLTLRYLEQAGDGAETTIVYGVNGDMLMRQREGQAPQPLAEGVTGLFVTGYVRPDGTSTTSQLSPADAKGLELLLTYVQAGAERSEEFTVAMP